MHRLLASSALVLCTLALACGDSAGGSESDSGSQVSSAGSSPSTTTPQTSDPSTTAGGSGSASTTAGGGTMGESDSGATTTPETKYDVGAQETTTGDPTTGDELGCKKVDILFVIDDSGSMSDEQNKLTAAFPSLVETIDQELVQEKNINYRIGVVSTDMAGTEKCVLNLICGQGHRGKLQHHADRLNCQNDEPPGKWIEQGPVNTVATQFQCIASMNGGEFDEMPLEAARAALVDRVIDQEAYNAGFLRDDALLVLVIFTDEDDQSVWEIPETWGLIPPPTTPVQEYYNQFVDLKGGETDRLAIVVFSGPKDTSCGDVMNDNGAVQAPRLHSLIENTPQNAYWGSICDNDFTTPLHEALDVIEAVCDMFPPPV
ncbi:MAG: hypothetical protein H6713_12330 [Myxococcales bacterium]|nr:hypothetical protein [Myxococcales bacterium]